MKSILLFIVLTIAIKLFSQFNIPEPIINTGNYIITDTVYMSVNGDDSNPGTIDMPVKSFNIALQKLPFGTSEVNNGNSYGLIMLLPGYYLTDGFIQSEPQWHDGQGGYKNVSIEGIGEVIIGGTPDNFSSNQLLRLRGSHIYIKNLKLKYGNFSGIHLFNDNQSNIRQNNVLIDNVRVDSVKIFSMILINVDTILVRNSGSFYASQPGNENLTYPCQWPSGIKFNGCSYCTIHDSEIAFTRGEGLNFHNSIYCKSYRNKLHDNTLNLYNDNSAKLSIHNNLIYNTPGLWESFCRTCPGDVNPVLAGRGLLVANEGACISGNLPSFENCQTKCTAPIEFFPNVDSMFVFNNIFQNLGNNIGFWQGNTDIIGVNCIKNVFITNNTFIGMVGMEGTTNWPFISFHFASYNFLFNNFYSTMENVRITNNIFSYDTVTYPNIQPVQTAFHSLHPGPLDFAFDGNIWLQTHQFMGVNDIVRTNLPGSLDFIGDNINLILPCPENQPFVYSQPPAFDFITHDFYGNPRNSQMTNVGALEFNEFCNLTIENITLPYNKNKIKVYPNPCYDCKKLFISGNLENENLNYTIYSIEGKILKTATTNSNEIDISDIKYKGFSILKLENKTNLNSEKLILY
ncbi:MAG TPA: T9SS type A sorting domain-containing protein [Bacteroidales bacterium]|nr:T9SS type A sorting domain-containing protein [Bacteroidales bacterium]HOL97243.1 T9SS type A sorting domain-containing protein [Bacteroidales bacterium]HOM35535.1 T9SS type A sorting domain-containing protein [Bacteroidales bacterium]HPD23844.1 T9SS type A sorting domain-containing protein [Bacteroidales bacterium]HRS98768.1 T9SS type A sorting domain-containing protein [Bacteroidales bacterium]